MMLIVLAITGATGYVAENNLRANQERLLNAQFQNQLRSFLAVQNLRSNAVADKSRDVSRSVRLRAALEEKDVDDLYRNALAELQDVFVPNEPADSSEYLMHAAFFRFVDVHGMVLPPGDYLAVALEYVEDGSWNDPEYLESIRRYAQRVKLGDSGSQTLALKLVSPQ